MEVERSPSPVVLTIAGSDPSGGAGIQRDLRTLDAVGVRGVSAITAITAQNTRGVVEVFCVPARHLTTQLDALFSDIPIAGVKIGMLGGGAQLSAVVAALRRHRPPHVVLDPVLAATQGEPLLSPGGRSLLPSRLLPLCDLVTPNLPELQAITGQPVDTQDEVTVAAMSLLDRGARAVLVTGGHRPDEPTDLLVRREMPPVSFPGPRVATPHTHGTGCLLSTAIAAFLARGASLEAAVRRAKALVTAALQNPIVLGHGRGYPEVVTTAPSTVAAAARVGGLYVLTDTDLRPDRGAEEIVAAALAGGARIVQLRDKRQSTAALIPLARRLRQMAHAAYALFIVNDRVDVALAADADGVHLGPDDMDPRDARRLLGPDRIVGVSVSSVAEAAPLAAVASYLGVGAIFGSSTKQDAGPPVGVARIREIRSAFPDHPIVAIGGIGRETIDDVIAAGADAVAVISAVVCAPDMVAATRELAGAFGP